MPRQWHHCRHGKGRTPAQHTSTATQRCQEELGGVHCKAPRRQGHAPPAAKHNKLHNKSPGCPVPVQENPRTTGPPPPSVPKSQKTPVGGSHPPPLHKKRSAPPTSWRRQAKDATATHHARLKRMRNIPLPEAPRAVLPHNPASCLGHTHTPKYWRLSDLLRPRRGQLVTDGETLFLRRQEAARSEMPV